MPPTNRVQHQKVQFTQMIQEQRLRKLWVASSVFRYTKMEVIDRHQYLGVDTRSHNFKNILRKGLKIDKKASNVKQNCIV